MATLTNAPDSCNGQSAARDDTSDAEAPITRRSSAIAVKVCDANPKPPPSPPPIDLFNDNQSISSLPGDVECNSQDVARLSGIPGRERVIAQQKVLRAPGIPNLEVPR